ncbi:MAG: TIGR03663 family protein [Pleurocapsa minor GSE-CHR-MK-17-07R]|jgi:uncharacterized protein (TIGR03663 family)|nr:TIGR03663 family protein [Pleurocapsa minor GSE-CHR-MK 17-07R]
MATTYSQNPQTRDGDFISRLLARPVVINWYMMAFFLIFVVAIITRFAGLGDRVMSHDESLHTYYSWELFERGIFKHTPLMHGPILFHMTALMYALFGTNDFTARLYPAILGVGMVMFPLLFRRWLGRTGALLAAILILISPLLLYHHRYIREDTPAIFATMVMVWCIFQYIDGAAGVRRKARWLYIFSGALLWNLGSKETAFMYIAIFGLFLTIFCGVRLYQHISKRPSRTLFYHLILPSLFGGVLALILFSVLAISLETYSATLQGRIDYLVANILNRPLITTPSGSEVVNPPGTSLEFNMFIGWTSVFILSTITIIVATALYAFRKTKARLPIAEIVIVIALSLAVASALVVFEEVSKLPSRTEAIAEDPDYDVIDTVAEDTWPLLVTWVACGAVMAVLVVSVRKGWWKTLRRFPELDVMIITGTLALPWLTAFPVYLTGASPRDYSPEGVTRTLMVFIPLAIVAITFGLIWNAKRWLISAAVFHALFAFFFTTMFTNPEGLVTGMIGSLGYWLDQQGVRRGGQPQYYYQMVIMPVYEYLPMIGSFLAMIAGTTGFWFFRKNVKEFRQRLDAQELPEATAEGEAAPVVLTPEARKRAEYWGPNRLRRLPFTLFVAFWAIYIFISFTLAGEKMPWLATHLTLPMILLIAWFFGRLFDKIDWSRFRQGGWIILLLLAPVTVALFQIISPFVFNQWSNLFSGLTVQDQQARNLWLALIAVVVIFGALIFMVTQRVGLRQLRAMIVLFIFGGLSLATARTAWMASYVNYDYATEYMVYAHAAPGIKLMMNQIEELSRRTAGELNIRFAWGGNAWPVSWYFRDLNNAVFFGNNPNADALRDAVAVYASEDIRARVEPILGDNYYRFDYMRMWWPSWNYYNLNAQRVSNALDLSPENLQAGQIRRGIWDIFLNRNYQTYGEATGETYDVANWNPGERLYFYVRKDIAAQVWNLGVGGGGVEIASAQPNLCIDNWQPLAGTMVYATGADGLTLPMNHAVDVAVTANGEVVVADEFNNRVVRFDANGGLISEISSFGDSIPLQRPNGVAISPDGSLWVADTWNYRIGQYDLGSGQPINGFGQPVLEGAAVQTEPTDGFWAPRDIAVDPFGNVYVSDTGNKRVRVYDAEGNFLRDIGSAGAGLGNLDEPAGLAVGTDRLYVADTWNRRISVFALDGTPLYTFEVRGWLEDQGNRPYIGLDEARNLLYVGDPEAGRVLVYDTQGNCVGSFGQPSEVATDLSVFDAVGGITVGPDGSVYVVDSSINRVIRFAPFIAGVASVPAEQSVIEEVLSDSADGVVVGVQAEEMTAEVAPEVTEAAG